MIDCDDPGGKRLLMVDVSKPSDCSVSCTDDGVTTPVEFGSRTENDSRSECSIDGGSRVRGSL